MRQGVGRDFQPRSCTSEAFSDCVFGTREKRTDDFPAVTLEDRTGAVESMAEWLECHPSIHPSVVRTS
jgi:hypothetical protein